MTLHLDSLTQPLPPPSPGNKKDRIMTILKKYKNVLLPAKWKIVEKINKEKWEVVKQFFSLFSIFFLLSALSNIFFFNCLSSWLFLMFSGPGEGSTLHSILCNFIHYWYCRTISSSGLSGLNSENLDRIVVKYLRYHKGNFYSFLIWPQNSTWYPYEQTKNILMKILYLAKIF